MYKQNRLVSVETATSYNDVGSIVTFKIPQSYGTVDYSKSYLLFYHDLQFLNATGQVVNPPAAQVPIVLQNNGNYLPPGAIVRSYSHSIGDVTTADIADRNVLEANIKHFSLDSEEKMVKCFKHRQ